jgi:hypothetical protein
MTKPASQKFIRTIIIICAIEAVVLFLVIAFIPVDVVENGQSHTVFTYSALSSPGAHQNAYFLAFELLGIGLVSSAIIVTTVFKYRRDKRSITQEEVFPAPKRRR